MARAPTALDSSDHRFLERAFVLAERGRGTVSPNPLVGCVLVNRAGEIVGEGWHARAGGPHAEVVALAEAGPAARGATAYVTLEPCAHTGRTPPCTDALVRGGVRRVVFALSDPSPVADGGAEALAEAGVEVVADVAPERARRQNEVFLHTVQHGRPLVIVKIAQSLDGRVAAADGSSKWITGEASRRRAHELRAAVDAIVVGSGTVLTDDPHLTVRLPDYRGEQPLRVVLDRRGRVTGANLRVLDDAAPTLVSDVSRPRWLLAELWQREVRSVLVEGGPTVVGAFLEAGLVDKLVIHLGAMLLGDRGLGSVRADVRTLAVATRWRLEEVEQLDGDVILTYYPEQEGG